ncbi:molybdopterin-dependent oxidoreductase [Rhizobium sp. AN80A]|uniref:molybdopterin-dependent oxidoreductase n=1 Tax=Rhizobium sp. AN80A TaxID=3040673 RepID=UPI000DB94640|nr:molybdopterin-dependent oxidoreductase [Rhizobium sp. AN80A]
MRKFLSAVVLATAMVLPAVSHALDAPKGDVVLTVKGKLDHPNVDGTAQFDMAMLEGLQGRKGAMETPWTTGKVEFSGPLLRSVLEAAGAHPRKIKVVALNDYAAEVPAEDASKIDTMLATRMDGQLMSVREKGPLFLIYPFDKDTSLYNEKYFSRSVWQIKMIEAE